MYREDINIDGKLQRKQKQVRLGTLAEIPTKNAARNKLSEFLNTTPVMGMFFRDLVKRWQDAEGPVLKTTTFAHYNNALRAYVLPAFGGRVIASINREDVQTFLSAQAKKYSKSALRSMGAVSSQTLGWERVCGWIQVNPCEGARLPKATAGRSVTRTVLTDAEVASIASNLPEPYATLVLFLSASGLRIGEAIAVRWSDFVGNVLRVTKRIYDGEEDSVKTTRSVRELPIDADLLERMRSLGTGEFVFRSEAGTPVNPGNALKRYIRPVVEKLGIHLGGWHDFRLTLGTNLRRNGAHPKVVSGIPGHARVSLSMDVYDSHECKRLPAPSGGCCRKLVTRCCKVCIGGLNRC